MQWYHHCVASSSTELMFKHYWVLERATLPMQLLVTEIYRLEALGGDHSAVPNTFYVVMGRRLYTICAFLKLLEQKTDALSIHLDTISIKRNPINKISAKLHRVGGSISTNRCIKVYKYVDLIWNTCLLCWIVSNRRTVFEKRQSVTRTLSRDGRGKVSLVSGLFLYNDAASITSATCSDGGLAVYSTKLDEPVLISCI